MIQSAESTQPPKKLREHIQTEKKLILSQMIQYLLSQSELQNQAQIRKLLNKYQAELNNRGPWTIEQVGDDLQKYLQEELYDQTVLNQIQEYVSVYTEAQGVQQNQLIGNLQKLYLESHTNQNSRNTKKPQFIGIQNYVINQGDRIEEIMRKLYPTTQILDQLEPESQTLRKHLIEKQQDIDYVIMETYGLNQHQYHELLMYLPVTTDDEFVQNKFLPTLNITRGDIQQALNILSDHPLSQNLKYANIQITNKGKGLLCCQHDGFQENELVGFYYGEIYTPSRWYEKQAILKKRLQEANKKQLFLIPHQDFYLNSDLLIVDASRYGNAITLINTSCRPNCELRTQMINGEYKLCLYTKSKIDYMEELSLQVNEDEDCFCGSYDCLKNFKIAAIASYVERNVNILKSSVVQFDNHVFGRTVKEGCPQWLLSWAYLTLENDQQIKQIITSIDKAKYVMQSVNSYEAPLKILEEQEVYEVFWKDAFHQIGKFGEQSIMQEIYYLLHKYPTSMNNRLLQLIKEFNSFINKSEFKMALTRLLTLVLSHLLLQLNSENFHTQGLGIVLYFMSFTHTYFRPSHYPGFNSSEFEESEFEPIPQPKNKQKLPLSRSYTPQYVWGQLVEWHKQVLQNPQSSMAQERRGVLLYPSLMLSFGNKHKNFPYQTKTLDKYIKYFITKENIQPDLSTWSYKNTHNIYGTIYFEENYSKDIVGPKYMQKVCKNALETINKKFYVFLEIEMAFMNNFNLKTTLLDAFQFCMAQQGKIYNFETRQDKKNEDILIVEGDIVYDYIQDTFHY